ncbi:MAG: hypothetical protein J4432_00785 [DPANN group archaeon]|nr:hypothetical protein [DPANN group archaeon]
MKTTRVVFSDEAEEVYKYLNVQAKKSKIEASILRAIKNKSELIKANPQYGETIAKSKIPEDYKIKYDVKSLYWVPLPNFWRMFYTLSKNGEIEIIAFVLDFLDHKQYNKKFGYKS